MMAVIIRSIIDIELGKKPGKAGFAKLSLCI